MRSQRLSETAPKERVSIRGEQPKGFMQRMVDPDERAYALSGLRAMLELDGHAVETAADGETGLALLLAQSGPEVAVVDIGLPGISGYELAQRARAGGYGGHLIALTGYGQGRDLRRSMDAGFDAHLVKPVDAEKLRQQLAVA